MNGDCDFEHFSKRTIIIRQTEIKSVNFKNNLFPVSKIRKTVGDSVEISWTSPFFPRAGAYNIYHTNEKNKSIPIIRVTTKEVSTQNRKYEYLSKPITSTNIKFMIRNITLDDAGYYAGGTKAGDAWSGGGVVLIVLGKSSIGLLLIVAFLTSCLIIFYFFLILWFSF